MPRWRLYRLEPLSGLAWRPCPLRGGALRPTAGAWPVPGFAHPAARPLASVRQMSGHESSAPRPPTTWFGRHCARETRSRARGVDEVTRGDQASASIVPHWSERAIATARPGNRGDLRGAGDRFRPRGVGQIVSCLAPAMVKTHGCPVMSTGSCLSPPRPRQSDCCSEARVG